MKTWLIGIFVFLLWSAGSTYWYVCRVKGLCWAESNDARAPGAESLADGDAGNAVGIDSLPTTSVDRGVPTNSGDTAAAEPAAVEPKGATNPVSGLLAKPYTVLFAFAGPQSENPAAFEQYLAELTAYLKAHPSQKALLRGYTDDTAARENNLKLAQRRCNVIADKLRGLGLSDAQIVTEPMGEADPVATNDTPEGRRLNRRVVISIQE